MHYQEPRIETTRQTTSEIRLVSLRIFEVTHPLRRVRRQSLASCCEHTKKVQQHSNKGEQFTCDETMQFQYNSDYPGLDEFGPAASPEAIAQDPRPFPPAQPKPCARLTTRIFHPSRNQVAMVQNVLVPTSNVGQPISVGGGGVASREADTIDLTKGGLNGGSLSSGMSSSSDSSEDDDDSMNLDDSGGLSGDRSMPQPSPEQSLDLPSHAFWIQRTIREAIYGRVLFAVVLKRRSTALMTADGAEWEVTGDHCAVKEMSWNHIRKERDRLAEDPIKEVAGMQYMHSILRKAQGIAGISGDIVSESFAAMKDTNIMMPLDLLSDERNLYSIMPYCDGGELFERLDMNERFTEEEARYWMDQVLNVRTAGVSVCAGLFCRRMANVAHATTTSVFSLQGLDNLQRVGICHRDMSLENLLVHKDGALIIDMGMCLLIPYQNDEAPHSLMESFDNMNMNGGAVASANNTQQEQQQLLQKQHLQLLSGRQRPRYLIRPQGTCGKWIYMSPEIYLNNEPFDGFAVDMWAAGVILFLMLTGFPPWERACQTDERFHYMTAGYLVQMLTEWEIGLTSDAMDLLQRMLFLDPKDRLSLTQVRAHPWMQNGRRSHPSGLAR